MTAGPPRSPGVRLSFKLQSPLFRLNALSPTFTIELANPRPSQEDGKPLEPQAPAPPVNDNPDTSLSPTPQTKAQEDGLSPMPAMDEAPATSKSTEVQNRMIDQQLELLGELFPEQMKKYSQTVDAKALETMMISMTDAPPVPAVNNRHSAVLEATDNSSDFHKSPESSQVPLSSDWPKLPDISDSEDTPSSFSESPASAAQTDKLQQNVVVATPSTPDKPLMERRSIVPNLRVDTVNSQQYATKELLLIRKMKEQSKAKEAAKAVQPSEEFRREPKQEPVETITKPILDSAERPDRRASDPADKRSPKVSEADTPSDSVKAQDGSTAAANIKAKKAHRNSTDSSMSGIVWSAVVEKFSEMAQEIAGEKPSASSSNRLAAPHATIKSSALSVSSVAISSESSYTISEAASDSGAEKTTNSVNPSPGSPEDKDEEQDTLDSDDHASPPGTLNTSPKVSVVIEATKSLSEVLNLPPIKRRSKSFVATSIMKKPTKPVAEEVPASDSSSYQSGAYTVIKLRRGRTVRVQSHHAVNVEGDYAAFLAKASGGEKRGRDDGDTLSLKSGKSNRSGRSAWSTKSGVENGCFRRGSMRSIKTGRTIATVGDVSIRDLSRGARFRHPNPFFSQQHGFRKIKAPHQTGPGMLRRKGSKIVRLSVFEGTSLATDTLSKRKSDDGETLGCTLARMKDAKRKAPTPLIGELSFENDEPAKPPSQPRLPPPTQTIPAPPRQVALSKENLAAYAATAIGVSSKPPSEPALANLAYAASAYMTIPTSKASSNISLNGQAQYPFPMIPASLPPVPLVSIKGFPQPPSALPGFKQPSSNVSIPTGPMPASSVMSVSRANILGAQMRGAQMLGAAASTISVASNRSNASPKRGKSGQTPPRPSPGRKHSQPQSAKTAVSMPMSKVEDSFISMTPARSEMSIKSSKSTDPASWDSNVSQRQYGPGSLQNNVMPSSVPAPSQLPQDARATYKSKNTMRASTAPLPPLPDEYSNKPLPLRESNVSQIDNAHRSRTSAHRPIKRLTVDTEAAKEQARKQLLAKQIAAEQRQKTLALEEGKKATRASAVAQGGLPDFDTKALPLGNTATDAPKTSSSLTDKMASVFTPRRPNRKESASELPARVPRPPSAEPLDPALDQFGHGQHVRRDSTATDSSHGASSIMGKSKGMTRIFGFGRNRAKV